MCTPGTRGTRPLWSPAQALYLLALGLGDVKKLLSMDSCPCALAPEDYECRGYFCSVGEPAGGDFLWAGLQSKGTRHPELLSLARSPPAPEPPS